MIASLLKSALLLAGVSTIAVRSSDAQDQLGWGRATQVLAGTTATNAALAASIAEWKALQQPSGYSFERYARFLLAHPGWPGEMGLRRAAERSLDLGGWSPSTVVAFFHRFPALTGSGRTRFAEALAATGVREDVNAAARAAWVPAPPSTADEARSFTAFAYAPTPSYHNSRRDTLLRLCPLPAPHRHMARV